MQKEEPNQHIQERVQKHQTILHWQTIIISRKRERQICFGSILMQLDYLFDLWRLCWAWEWELYPGCPYFWGHIDEIRWKRNWIYALSAGVNVVPKILFWIHTFRGPSSVTPIWTSASWFFYTRSGPLPNRAPWFWALQLNNIPYLGSDEGCIWMNEKYCIRAKCMLEIPVEIYSVLAEKACITWAKDGEMARERNRKDERERERKR